VLRNLAQPLGSPLARCGGIDVVRCRGSRRAHQRRVAASVMCLRRCAKATDDGPQSGNVRKCSARRNPEKIPEKYLRVSDLEKVDPLGRGLEPYLHHREPLAAPSGMHRTQSGSCGR
jgi:hypothetical protein